MAVGFEAAPRREFLGALGTGVFDGIRGGRFAVGAAVAVVMSVEPPIVEPAGSTTVPVNVGFATGALRASDALSAVTVLESALVPTVVASVFSALWSALSAKAEVTADWSALSASEAVSWSVTTLCALKAAMSASTRGLVSASVQSRCTIPFIIRKK